MHNIQSRPLIRGLRISLMGIAVALCLLILTTGSVFASAQIRVSDNAHVYNSSQISQIENEGQNLNYPLDIFTVTGFTGSKTQFEQQAHSHVDTSSKMVMAIDTDSSHRFVYLTGGTGVPLNSSQYTQTGNTFASNFSNGGYTGATIAAIRSLESMLSNSNSGTTNPTNNPSSGAGGIFSGLGGTLCCVGLIVLLLLAVFAFMRRRSSGGFGRFGFGRRQPVMPYQQPYDPNYPNGYPAGYPPNYGPGYPGYPNYQGRQGMNPWAAGGIGAVGGGLLGYELGREQGENENREQGQQGGNVDNSGNWSGGGADFGGTNNGGNDWGGGGGGGADFGGGGGGGDFGGGGGGSSF